MVSLTTLGSNNLLVSQHVYDNSCIKYAVSTKLKKELLGYYSQWINFIRIKPDFRSKKIEPFLIGNNI